MLQWVIRSTFYFANVIQHLKQMQCFIFYKKIDFSYENSMLVSQSYIQAVVPLIKMNRPEDY